MQALLTGIAAQGRWAVFAAALGSFVFLYSAFAGLAWWLSRRVLPAWNIGAIVDDRPLRPGQIGREIRRSAVSIAIFAAYGSLTVEAYRFGWVSVVWEPSLTRTLADTLLLFLWNEAHFFLCHRLLHARWLFHRVHRIHHESIVATPFSTYSFHWAEAALLGSVMILAMLARDFSVWALLALPIFSLLFNTIGHWNYNLFAGTPRRSASVEHSLHHRRAAGNYGFYLPFFDRLFRTSL